MSRRASPHATCRPPPKKRKVRPRAFGIDLRLLLAGARSSRAEVTKRPSVSGSVSPVCFFFTTRQGILPRRSRPIALGGCTICPLASSFLTAEGSVARLGARRPCFQGSFVSRTSRERLCRSSRALFYSAFPRRVGFGAFRPRAPRGSRESETRARRRGRAHPLSPLTRTRARRLGTRRAEHGRARRRQGGAPGKQQSALERRERGRR